MKEIVQGSEVFVAVFEGVGRGEGGVDGGVWKRDVVFGGEGEEEGWREGAFDVEVVLAFW